MVSSTESGAMSATEIELRLQAFKAGAQSSMRDAIGLTLLDCAQQDPSVRVLGEAVGQLGGVHGVTRGLRQALGEERVIDLPLSEAGAVGLCIGMAMGGQRPVLELGSGLADAAQQLLEELAGLSSRSKGEFSAPVVVRLVLDGAPGGTPDADAQMLAMLCQAPGLRVTAAADAAQAQGLLRAALSAAGPTVVLEPASAYSERGPYIEVKLTADAVVRREGEQLTVVTWGAGVKTAQAAAEQLAEQGASVEVLQLLSLKPTEVAALGESVRRTGRVVVFSPTRNTELAQRILSAATDAAFLFLEAPPSVFAGSSEELARVALASITY